MEQETPFLDEWPKVSFTDIANERVEGGRIVGALYRSFFALLSLPETVLSSFLTLLKEEPR